MAPRPRVGGHFCVVVPPRTPSVSQRVFLYLLLCFGSVGRLRAAESVVDYPSHRGRGCVEPTHYDHLYARQRGAVGAPRRILALACVSATVCLRDCGVVPCCSGGVCRWSSWICPRLSVCDDSLRGVVFSVLCGAAVVFLAVPLTSPQAPVRVHCYPRCGPEWHGADAVAAGAR